MAVVNPADLPPPRDSEGAPAPTGRRSRAVLGDLAIRIDRDGTWYYHGSPIARKELVRLFASALTADAAGGFWLVTPAEIGRIEVEDAPFVAVALLAAGSGRDQVLRFRTNIDEVVTVDQDHPIRVATAAATGEPLPTVTVRPRIEARLLRPVYYELVARGAEEIVDHAMVYGVWSKEVFFPLETPDRTR